MRLSARPSPILTRATSERVRDTQSCSKSPWTSYVDSIGGRGVRGPRPASLWRLKHVMLARTHTTFGLLPGAQNSSDCGPARKNFRAEGALSSRCITTDYSPMILECPQDAHRGSLERYPDMCATCKVALNRHGTRPWIVLVGEGVGRARRAQNIFLE